VLLEGGIELLEGFENVSFSHAPSHLIQLVKLKGGRQRVKFTLRERDLEEKFTKGFGPGGQKTNKSNNCVNLLHKPTGLTVKSHDNRLQQINR